MGKPLFDPRIDCYVEHKGLVADIESFKETYDTENLNVYDTVEENSCPVKQRVNCFFSYS